MKEDLIGPVLKVPKDINPEEFIDFKVDDDDPDIRPSAPSVEVYVDPLMQNLDVPSDRKYDSCSAVDKERWQLVVATLLQRGVTNPKQMAGLTRLTYRLANKLIKEVKNTWVESLTQDQVNSRREQLYLEAERVKDYAWQALTVVDSDAMRLKYLQLVLQAGQRQSSLIGAERHQISVEATTTASHKSASDFESEFFEAQGIDPQQLKLLGDSLSKHLTFNKKEDED